MRIRNVQNKLFKLQRIAIKECYYMPEKSLLKKSSISEENYNNVMCEILKKYPELDEKKLKYCMLTYKFNVGDIIPHNMPISNIHPVVYYKTCITK